MIFAFVIMSLGVALILGAFFRLSGIVDPPTNWAPFYSQALIKKLFGVYFLRLFTYALGILFVSVSLIMMFGN